MKRRSRNTYTVQQKELMLDPYKQGCSLTDIARLFERHHYTVSGIISASGGIRPNDKQREKNI